jgi:hypothetical protein
MKYSAEIQPFLMKKRERKEPRSAASLLNKRNYLWNKIHCGRDLRRRAEYEDCRFYRYIFTSGEWRY